MTLEQINEIADKHERLRLLKQYIHETLGEDRDYQRSEAGSDEELHLSRDEAGGMMSRVGKPDNS